MADKVVDWPQGLDRLWGKLKPMRLWVLSAAFQTWDQNKRSQFISAAPDHSHPFPDGSEAISKQGVWVLLTERDAEPMDTDAAHFVQRFDPDAYDLLVPLAS
jgi:hypothetical protein